MPEPIIGDLADMFPDDLIVEPYMGSSDSGSSTYGAPFTVKARIVGRTKIVADQDGNESVSSVQATIAGAYGLDSKDRFTVPVRFSSNPRDPSDLVARQPRALAVDRASDENGAHHETVQFSNARIRSF